MKNTLLLLTLLLFACGNNNKTGEAVKLDPNFKTYTNSDKQFSIDYPTQWKTPPPEDSYVLFYAVEADPDTADKFNESFSVLFFPSEGYTLEQIVDQNIKSVEAKYINPKIDQVKSKNAKGFEFVNLTFSVEEQGLQLTTFTTFFLHNNKFITISQATETKYKSKYGPIFKQVVNSFCWTDKK